MSGKSGHGMSAMETRFCELPNPAHVGSAGYADFVAALEQQTAFRSKIGRSTALRVEVESLIWDTVRGLIVCAHIDGRSYQRVETDLSRLGLFDANLYREVQRSLIPRPTTSRTSPIAAVA